MFINKRNWHPTELKNNRQTNITLASTGHKDILYWTFSSVSLSASHHLKLNTATNIDFIGVLHEKCFTWFYRTVNSDQTKFCIVVLRTYFVGLEYSMYGICNYNVVLLWWLKERKRFGNTFGSSNIKYQCEELLFILPHASHSLL